MKKRLLIVMCVIGCSFLAACGGKDTDTQTQTDAPVVQNEESEADATTETSASEKDFDGSSYSDTGDGTFLLVNSSGNTENGNVIVVYASADTALEQIGYETSGMNGGALSYIYIDGMLSTNEQLGDERINLAVPKGMKEVIKGLASGKNMSVNAYIQDLIRKDQCGMFDTMQIAEKNREMISGIQGNMHDGYDVIFKDGHSCHCRTKKDVRSCIIEYCCKKDD